MATKTRKYLTELTPAQRGRMDEWADRWIEIGLRTGPADRARFEAAVQECYRYAGIPWPGVVVWVPSPLVLAMAAPTAALAIELIRRKRSAAQPLSGGAVRGAVDGAVGVAVRGAVDGAVRVAVGVAVGDAVRDAVDGAVRVAVGGAVGDAVRDAVGDAVRDAVDDAVDGAVRDAVDGAVRVAVGVAVDGAVGVAVRDAVDGAVRVAVDGAVGVAVRDAVDGAVRDAVGVAVGVAVRDAVDGAVRDAVGVAVGDAVRDAVDDAVDGAVRDAVGVAVGDAVGGAVGVAVRDAVDDAVRDAVDGAVRDAVDGAVRDAVDGAVRQVIGRAWANYFGGQFWVGGWGWGGAWTSFFREVCEVPLDGDLWDRAKAYEATMESACWWWPHRDFVMVSERPLVIHRELANPAVTRGWGSHRLHCATGPAIAWPDGWGLYRWHGVTVPPHVITQPDTITVAEIQQETNAEVRRVMLERYGIVRYLADSGAVPVHADETGTLYRCEQGEDEPLVVVSVLNRTAEPDGHFKTYHLRVPPTMQTARAAVAWTFDMAAKDYAPVIET